VSSAELARRLKSERWFRDKAKNLTRVRRLDRVNLHPGALELVVAEFEEAEPAIYVLLEDELAAVARILELALGKKLEARALGSDHTNGCYVFEDQIVGKLSRKLESGPSVELEVLNALHSLREKPRVPRPLGAFALGPATLMTFTRFVSNEGDAFGKRLHPKQAKLLGKRTGELHLALAQCFPPSGFGPRARDELAKSIRQSAYYVFERLPKRMPKSANRAVTQVLSRIVARGSFGKRMRIHGDLHLGQVLVTRGDFVFLDFDGEPARPLADRRRKRSPLADVAGMLRSFEYANLDFGREYLAAYLDVVGSAEIVPTGEEARRALLDALLLEKVLYEIRYELEHRPSWLHVPLAGFAKLCDLVCSTS
jgi:predicted trehalose synthase